MVWYQCRASACAWRSPGGRHRRESVARRSGRGRSTAARPRADRVAGSVREMPRPVPPQVIPRPATWRARRPGAVGGHPGGPAKGDRHPAGAPRPRRPGPAWSRARRHRRGRHVPRGHHRQRVGGAAGASRQRRRPGRAVRRGGRGPRDPDPALLAACAPTRARSAFPAAGSNEGEDPTAAARREAHEEVGLNPALVTMVGWMHPVMTLASPALIMPVIATLPGRPAPGGQPGRGGAGLRRRPGRAGRPGHLPRGALAGPRARRSPAARTTRFPVRFFEVAGEMIWGATARMLSELITIVLTGETGL